jgi:hypothetical protein
VTARFAQVTSDRADAPRRRFEDIASCMSPPPRVSRDVERWLSQDRERTLGGLIERFGPKSFAFVFVLLLGLPALPVPTGGATHVFEIIAMLVALQLIVGRDEIWLPRRLRRLDVAGAQQQRFLTALIRMIRRLERVSRPRLRFLFGHRLSNVVFGTLVVGLSGAAFLAPPFTGLDTLPAVGVVLLSMGVLLEDGAIVLVALLAGAAGVVLELFLGTAAIQGLGSLL